MCAERPCFLGEKSWRRNIQCGKDGDQGKTSCVVRRLGGLFGMEEGEKGVRNKSKREVRNTQKKKRQTQFEMYHPDCVISYMTKNLLEPVRQFDIFPSRGVIRTQ